MRWYTDGQVGFLCASRSKTIRSFYTTNGSCCMRSARGESELTCTKLFGLWESDRRSSVGSHIVWGGAKRILRRRAGKLGKR